MSAIVVLRVLQFLMAGAVAAIAFVSGLFSTGTLYMRIEPISGALAVLPILACISAFIHLIGMCGRPRKIGTMKFYIIADTVLGVSTLVCGAIAAFILEVGNTLAIVCSSGFNVFDIYCILWRTVYILGMLLHCLNS